MKRVFRGSSYLASESASTLLQTPRLQTAANNEIICLSDHHILLIRFGSTAIPFHGYNEECCYLSFIPFENYSPMMSECVSQEEFVHVRTLRCLRPEYFLYRIFQVSSTYFKFCKRTKWSVSARVFSWPTEKTTQKGHVCRKLWGKQPVCIFFEMLKHPSSRGWHMQSFFQ